jgi:ABC-type spermidine/putrescine transport system permease subunit II
LTSGASSQLPLEILDQLRNGMAQSLHSIFVLIFAVALINLLLSAFLPSHRKIMEQQENLDRTVNPDASD